MDSEFKNFIKVWVLAIASLTYCYFISFIIPKGKLRVLALLPVFFFLTILPMNLTTVLVGGSTAFYLTWLANFKLLLFSFGHGPLSSDPPMSLAHFLLIASLPIQITKSNQNPSPNTKIKHQPSSQIPSKPLKSTIYFTIKTILYIIIILPYNHIKHLPMKFKLTYYCCCIYIGIETTLSIVAAVAATVLGMKLEPQFNEPYLATSLQDFWGRRWNLMVTNIMRTAIYEPIKRISKTRIDGKWAPLPAVLCTFLVSGLMHELIYFYLSRSSPTWEVTCFFLLHGICLVIEVVVKKTVKWRLNRVISSMITVGFVIGTGSWLFFPQLQRCRVDARIGEEFESLVQFVKGSISNASSLGLSLLGAEGVLGA